MKPLISFLLVFAFVSCQSISQTKGQERSGSANEPPEFIEGLYINTKTIRDKKRWSLLFQVMKDAGMNTAVVDMQPHPPTPEQVAEAKALGIYMVARVVNFEGGLIEKSPNTSLMASIQKYHPQGM